MSEENGAIWANQFDNVANRQAHIDGTGPEIWAKPTVGRWLYLCLWVWGTLAGTAMALQPKGIKIGLADPMGSALFNHYANGELSSEGGSISEGSGGGELPKISKA